MIVHYKCLNCGADMVYDADRGQLHCGSCGREDRVEDLPEENISREFGEEDGLEYQCENCGASLLTDDDTVATTCSFCGAGMVLADRLTGLMAPSKVIPFKVSKERAQEAFKNWCGQGKLTPKDFMTADRIKNIAGIYIPFWLYDLNTQVQAGGRATKVRTYRQGDYRYTETRHYEIFRELDMHYIKVPVDASEKMDDGLMDRIEPYNYEEIHDFRPAYLAGYRAEKYNYSESELLPRVQAKVEGYVDSYLYSTTEAYDLVNFTNTQLDTRKKEAYYSLLPLWMVYYDYGGKDYVFAMNGQTGKVVGEPPISRKRVALRFILTFLGIFIGLKILIMILLGGGLW